MRITRRPSSLRPFGPPPDAQTCGSVAAWLGVNCLVALNIATEIQEFYRDQELLGPVNDESGWCITDHWAIKFQGHLSSLLVLAESGDAIAQKAVASIYFGGYLHASEEEAMESYPLNLEAATARWLKAMHGGEYNCVQLIIAVGVGKEAEFLKTVSIENQSILTRAQPPSREWEQDMRQLYAIAYPSS